VRRSPLAVVYVTVFVDLLGFGIILPLLPFYAKSYGANGLWVGALLTAYSAAQFLSSPYLGRLSDRVGRRPILLLSLAGSALALTLTGFAQSLWLLLIARTLDGLFGGSIATGQAYIADSVQPEERARSMGALGAAVGLGFVFGPALGAGLSRFGFGTAAFVAAGIAAANFVFAWFRLPESRGRGGPATQARFSLAVLGEALRRPAIARIVGAMFLATFAFASMEATFALFGQRRFGLDGAGFGEIFTYLGIVAIVVQGWLVRRLLARCNERQLAVAGAVLMAAGLLAVPLARSLPFAVASLTVLALGQGFVSPSLVTLLSRESGAHEQGGTLGIGQSAAAAARASGPLVAGLLYDATIGLPYLAAGLLALAGALLVARVAAPSPAGLPEESLVG
jgi:DHA1 family tetracycline resistance protein-like MFS transporter